MLLNCFYHEGISLRRYTCKTLKFYERAIQNKYDDNVAGEVSEPHDDSMLLKIGWIIMHALARTWILYVKK